MGKGYRRKTRWRTLSIGAPPGEEDEEDGIRNGYAKGQENGTSSRNGQSEHKTGRTDSAGSTTSDYASDYASAVSRSRRDDSGDLPSKPKIIFNENEYTRITTPRQDVLFKKGYLSRKKVWASTASTSATPSTTESQSASHSTVDGSETTEDQQLLDCKENGAEEYRATMEPGAQVAYGTFYDHASGYYYEYPVMVVGPDHGMPGPPMHNVLTAVPCGPVPLRPIEWANPAYVPEIGNQQYCVMDYQMAQLAQYPTLVDENFPSLTVPVENTNGCEEACFENGTGSASWSGSVADEEQNGDAQVDTQNGTAENNGSSSSSGDNNVPVEGEEESTEAANNSELYLENALAQQLHVTHVAVPPVPQPCMCPGHYMFGPSLVNVNGVTIQSGSMVQNTGGTWGRTNTRANPKRRKKKRFNQRKCRHLVGPGNAEDEEQEEEVYSSESENPAAALIEIAGTSEPGTAGIVAAVSVSSEKPVVTTSSNTPQRTLNPECQEFRPKLESRIVPSSIDATSFEAAATSLSNSDPSSSTESSDNQHQPAIVNEIDKKPTTPIEANELESTNSRITEPPTSPTDVKITEKLPKRSEGELVAAPVEFAAEVFADVTTIAERALASRSVIDGTPMETEIGVDVTSVNFREIVENHETSDVSPQSENARRNITGSSSSGRRRIEGVEEDVPNGQTTVEKQEYSHEETSSKDGASEIFAEAAVAIGKRPRVTNEPQRGSRSASPGMINRTTTPINAKSQRLPESYESLVIRGSNASASSSSSSSSVTTASSAQQQQSAARNRKYSVKGPKFVREATPGPDLDVIQLQGPIQQNSSEPEESIRMKIIKPESSVNRGPIVIATGIEAIEAEIQGYSVSTTGSFSYMENKRDANAEASNDDSGVESQRFSSDHPITDAVTEWLHRANSPELFVTSTMISESEPEDDELEDAEPPKNLHGNPMPALSANSSNVNDEKSSRLASCGKFASVIDTNTRYEKNNNNNNNDIDRKKDCIASRRKKRADGKRRGSKKCSTATNDVSPVQKRSPSTDVQDNNVESSRQRVEKIVNDVCEFTELDSVAGMRVAESSRIIKFGKDSYASRVDRSRRSNSRDKSTVIMLSSRDVPVENVEVKVRRITDDNDEGIVEDEEVNVRTFEKGEIVVSIEGKVLPVAAYEPILSQHRKIDDDNNVSNEIDERPMFRTITCEKSIREETEDTSAMSDNGASKRNSLGSIEEPDVLECWEVETVEPVTTPKIIQARDTSQQGEAAEDDFGPLPEIDQAGVEIVRKYYRLEATGDSGASVTSFDDYPKNERSDSVARSVEKNSIANSPERTIERLCSEEIPVIGERMNEIVEQIMNDSGIPIEESLEVYESCYTGKQQPYLVGFQTKFRRTGTLLGQDTDRDGVVPCKAACCNIQ